VLELTVGVSVTLGSSQVTVVEVPDGPDVDVVDGHWL
jgi:hypothetical protein